MKPAFLNFKSDRLLAILIVLGVVFHIIWYSLLWQQILTHPRLLMESDYLAFYTGGVAAQTYGFSATYDLSIQRDIEEKMRGHPLQPAELLSFNHPPLLLPVLQKITSNDFTASYLRWNVFSAMMTIVSMSVLMLIFKKTGWKNPQILVIAAASFLFYPLVLSILKGQDSFMLVLGAALILFGTFSEKDVLSGVGMIALTVKPQIALLLGLPFLFKRQKVLMWTFITGIIYAPILILLDIKGIKDFINLLSISAGGENYSLNRAAMFNLAGILTRAGFTTNLVTTIAWVGFFAGTAVLSLLWMRTQNLELKHIVTAIILAVFFSPHLHYHDLALLIVPVLAVPLTAIGPNQKHRVWRAAFPMLISLAFLLFDLTDLPRLIFPYLLMAALLIWNWWPHFWGKSQPANA